MGIPCKMYPKIRQQHHQHYDVYLNHHNDLHIDQHQYVHVYNV